MKRRNQYYGVIGNGETCAFVSPSGSIDWLCLPRFDGKIVYAKALDPKNGKSLGIELFGRKRSFLLKGSGQSYYEKTNVLKTRLTCRNFEIVLRDFMPWNRRLIFRMVRIKNTAGSRKAAEMRMHSEIGKRYMDIKDRSVIHEDEDFCLMAGIEGKAGRFFLKPGEERNLTLIMAYGKTREIAERKLMMAGHLDSELELARCKRFWSNWMDAGKRVSFKNDEHRKIYFRSLLALKMLIYKNTGAVVAAPTTSFPAYPGYEENWDYRFAWIRDSYFIIRALLKSGHYTEVKSMLEFLFSVQGKNGHWKYPLYRIDGRMPRKESIIRELTGPNEEDTIRLSNEAKSQLQLDSEGSVLHAAYLYYLHTGDISFVKGHWKGVKAAAQWISRNYHRSENGIWEFRERRADWTYGKVLCYVGLESALAIASLFNKRYSSWQKARNRIKKDIFSRAWSEQRQAFLQTYESDSPADISALSIEDYGLLKPSDARIRKTVRLFEEKLLMDGGVKRFEDALLPFYLPTLWLAQHYIRAGDTRRANGLIMTAINGSTGLYLAAEHFDPKYNVQHGNFPQAFNASSFVETLLLLNEHRRKRWNFMNMLEWRRHMRLRNTAVPGAGRKAAGAAGQYS